MSLASLLFTDYRRRVLGLLLLRPDQSYHLREIARLTGTVAGTLTRELSKLADTGVLTKTKIGNQLQYRANKICPIYEELTSILRKTSGLVDVLAGALLPLTDRIELAFVYGSIASGKAHANSDIDVIVVGDVSFADVLTHLHSTQTTLGREINPKIYQTVEWKKFWAGKSSFAEDVRRKPKLFVIGNSSELNEQEK